MFTLREIMDNLTYGDLSHVSIGGAALGFIEDKDFPKIVSCLNGALTALHKRFLLRTGSVNIQQYADITTYHLRSEYTVSTGSILNTHYILDSVDEPFQDNVFKIESVSTIRESVEVSLPINDSTQSFPIYTPSFDTLTIPLVEESLEILAVKYRADHPRIKVTQGFDPALVELHIPSAILDAISLNVAARIYTPLTSGDGQNSAASAFMYQYELECKRLESESIALDDNTSDYRFENNGWI